MAYSAADFQPRIVLPTPQVFAVSPQNTHRVLVLTAAQEPEAVRAEKFMPILPAFVLPQFR